MEYVILLMGITIGAFAAYLTAEYAKVIAPKRDTTMPLLVLTLVLGLLTAFVWRVI